MVNPVLDGDEELAGGEEDPLSEESERKILEMVEDQLDRPNPPDTRVLYRRAMHFVDRDVRHLSLQQFNAKFPLQVKRRRARDRPEENGGPATGARAGENGASHGSTGAAGDAERGDAGSVGESRPRSSTERTRNRDRTMAVDRNPDVMEMVERELRADPDISNSELKAKAEEIDGEIADLSARQFNARYPLQVKRKLSEEESESRGEKEAAPASTATADGAGGDGAEEAAGASEQVEGDVRDRIMDLVRRLLRKEEDVSTREMQERAAEIDPAVEELSTRQFNARYPLQVKRKLSAMKSKIREKRGDGSRAPAGSDEQREVVREALLDFARAVAGAGDRGEVIDVLTRVDEYVDRVVEKL